jgi:CubicO group peptidase (beta-lactamase class C family)
MSQLDLDSVFAPYAVTGAPGAAVLIVNDTTVTIRTFGLADLAAGTPVTAETNFRLASLSKQFTATATVLSVNDGKLNFDSGVTRLFTGLPAHTAPITVAQLLSHTSGVWDYEDFVANDAPTVHDADVPGLVAKADSLYFAPGTRYRYSNSGYAILALAVERSSGQRYAEFLKERIFTPIGMTGTVALEEGISTVPNRAYGHSRPDSTWVRNDQSNTSAVLGDGGVYSNATDLAKWVRRLWTAPLVGPDLQQLMWTPATLADGTAKGPYGFGWFVDNDRGLRRLSHHGETRGFTNGFVMYPDRKVAVIVLTNRIGGGPWDLAQRVADAELGLSGTPAKFGF